MSNTLRTVTFQLEFNGADGLTGIRTFTKAVKDADATVNELTQQLGKNATVTYSNVQSKKELTEQAKRIANQFEKNIQNTEALTRSLQHQISMIGKSATQQAAMNAAYSLGATATDEQRQAVSKLAAALATIKADEAEVEAASAKRIAQQQAIGREIEKTQQNYKQLADQIRNEIRLVGESSDKQEINNAIRRLGANATDEQKRSIAELTARLTRLKSEQAELAAQEARSIADKQKTALAVENLSAHYKRMADMVNMSADQVEQLNAVQRLGSNATEAQKQQVLAAVQNYQRLRGATDEASGGFRNLRGVAQNAGWQLQDTIVQLQMGTSAFMVFSQQGSQFASAFGPTGAVIGAVIAIAGVVGGALYTALNDSAGATDRLTKLTENYGKYVTVTAGGVTELSSKLEELAKYSKLAADQQLRLARGDVLKAQAESLKVLSKEYKDFASPGFMTNTSLSQALGLGSNAEVYDLVKSISALKKEVNSDTLENYLKAVSRINPDAKNAQKGLDELKQKWIDHFYELSRGEEILKDTANGWEPIAKEAVTAVDEIIKAFESEYNSLVKQTESIDQEYTRRKQNIDAYVKYINGTDEKAKASYAALNQWRKTELDKEFQTLYDNLVKKTNTTEQEYARQKAIIDNFSAVTAEDESKKTQAYIDLEQWKTDEVEKEYNKRERIRRQIENAQIQQRRGDDPEGAETQLYSRNIIELTTQYNSLLETQYDERARINALIEDEVTRHNSVMADLNLQSYQNQVGLFAMAASQISSTVDLMTSGISNVKSKTAEMNGFQKTMFIISQTIAAANAFIAGISLGSQLAALFPLAAPAMITTGAAIGAAQAGAIMGVTLAGAFDEGGNVPAGQFGIVSEYGDELVNGMLVKGPARVTSREDTAELLNNAGSSTQVSMKVSIENNIKGASYDVRQISPDEVRIIAKQVFDQNIDSGVSGAIGNPNSKSARSMRSSYNVSRNLNGN